LHMDAAPGPPEGRTGRRAGTERRVRFDGTGQAPEEAPKAPGREEQGAFGIWDLGFGDKGNS